MTMDKFVDIHNHIAWEVDDGMDSKENAQIALSNAAKDGIGMIIATPHYVPGQYTMKDVFRIKSRVNETKQLADSYGIRLFEGGELFLNSGYLDMLDEKQCPTLANSRYLLCEFDVRKDLSHNEEDVEDKLYEIKVRGYVPVIAHVERYFHRKVDIERVRRWVKQGYKVQINRTSLLGLQGSVCQDNAITLLEEGLVHLIASDAHRCKGDRISKLSDVFDYLRKHYGEDVAQMLCIFNPTHIILNENLDAVLVEKKSRFARLFKRS